MTTTRHTAKATDPRRFFAKALTLLVAKYSTVPTPVGVGHSYGIAGAIWASEDFSVALQFTEDVVTALARAWRKDKAAKVLYGRFLKNAPCIDLALVAELVALWEARLASPSQAAA